MNKDLLEILACPKCHGDLKLGKSKLICIKCKKEYKIKDGIPILLVDDAVVA